MNQKRVPSMVAPGATAEETAAIAAALARFAADAAPSVDPQDRRLSAWQRAALDEGVTRAAAWQ